MKIIISRKGFDSKFGGTASPILPDGTMLSFPIPDEQGISYNSIKYDGKTYMDLWQELKPRQVEF